MIYLVLLKQNKKKKMLLAASFIVPYLIVITLYVLFCYYGFSAFTGNKVVVIDKIESLFEIACSVCGNSPFGNDIISCGLKIGNQCRNNFHRFFSVCSGKV